MTITTTAVTTFKPMTEFLGQPFESSSGLTPQFAAFARKARAYVKKLLEENGLELVNWNRGHFEFSGFVKSPVTGKFAYFRASDVRFFPNRWCESLLLRTAEHDKDYVGGSNTTTTLTELGVNAKRLTN